MALRIPVTATSMPDWIRKCATAVNDLISRMTNAEQNIGAADTRIATVEDRATALEDRATALEGDVSDLTTRVGNLEAYSAPAFTFAPQALPASPDTGETVFDTVDNKLKTWDGTTWQAHW